MRKMVQRSATFGLTQGRTPRQRRMIGASLLSLFVAITLSACGGSGSSGSPQPSGSISGNWQFTVQNPPDGTFLGGLQGGFLLQTNGSAVTGGAVYSVALPGQGGGNPTVCNSGSAPITGTNSGQTVTLTAVAGSQTFTFTGTLSSDGSTMSGTYTSTAGTAIDGTPCGTAQTGLQWSAISVPPLTGTIQGNFHSTSGINANQYFTLTGLLTQGPNVGASNATVTGTLTFIDPKTLLSPYPCFDMASVNGQISGNTVILQIIATNGANIGQIGAPANTNIGLQPVTFDSTSHGYVLHSTVSPAYAVNTPTCPGTSLSNAGDSGNICLALGSSNACQQPITLSPAFLIFPAQPLGPTVTTQTVTLSNTDPTGATLNDLQVQFSTSNGPFGGPSDFNGLPNFTEQDNCASSPGSTFSLAAGQSCSIKVSFSPQESCPWIPYGNPPSAFGAPPSYCPLPITATVTVVSPTSADIDTNFAVPVTGNGLSAIVPSTSELDFGAVDLNETGFPQLLTFTNRSSSSLQILGPAPCLNSSSTSHNSLPHPLQLDSPVAGLQVVSNDVFTITPNPPSILYRCDSDPQTALPNFQISTDTCTGAVLPAQGTCSLQIAYMPQPATVLNAGLDYFLELNSVQCSDTVTTNCEIDSGRFPVELRSNAPSPLRMLPAAGLDFGTQTVGMTTVSQSISLLNDPADATTVSFVGKVTVKGNYSETDDCPFSLAPGASCTLTVTFKPQSVGFIPGTLTINYSPNPSGTPQIVHLRGTGQPAPPVTN